MCTHIIFSTSNRRRPYSDWYTSTNTRVAKVTSQVWKPVRPVREKVSSCTTGLRVRSKKIITKIRRTSDSRRWHPNNIVNAGIDCFFLFFFSCHNTMYFHTVSRLDFYLHIIVYFYYYYFLFVYRNL